MCCSSENVKNVFFYVIRIYDIFILKNSYWAIAISYNNLDMQQFFEYNNENSQL